MAGRETQRASSFVKLAVADRLRHHGVHRAAQRFIVQRPDDDSGDILDVDRLIHW